MWGGERAPRTVWSKKAARTRNTLWILHTNIHLRIYALYTDEFLKFPNNRDMFLKFWAQFTKHFDIKSGTVGRSLGNRIVVESEHFKIFIDQLKYIHDILNKIEMETSHSVGTPMTKGFSVFLERRRTF